MNRVVIVLILSLPLTACKESLKDTYSSGSLSGSTDAVAPVVGTDVSFSAVTSASMTVDWGVSSDNVSGAAMLQYKLVSSNITDADIDTVAEADAATTVMDWTAATTSYNIAVLPPVRQVHYAVLVRDEANNVSLYTPKTVTQGKMIWQTPAIYDGNLGGVNGADTICTNERPTAISSSAAKAFLVDGVARVACSDANCTTSTDWMLAPSTNYYNAAGDFVAQTNGNKIFSTYGVAVYPAGAVWVDSAYTGLINNYWTPGLVNCNQWTSNSAAVSVNGVGHTPLSGLLDFVADAWMDCDTLAPLICVEQ